MQIVGRTWTVTAGSGAIVFGECHRIGHGNIEEYRSTRHWWIYNCRWWSCHRRRHWLQVSRSRIKFISALTVITLLEFSFFLDANSVGLSRAKCCMQLLQEMNPDVSSDYLDESIETLLENNPEFFSAFKIVIASSLKEKTLIALSRLLWEQNIPFVYCHSVGFIASARLQFTEHYVIETHPDNKQSDLRLEQPFEALQKYLDVRSANSSRFWSFY